MRRSDKEITDKKIIDEIINKTDVCRLGLCRENIPYIVPVSFGYNGNKIFIHTAIEGTKLDFISENNNVCFEFEHEVKLVENQSSACNWSFSYYSIIGFGKIYEITNSDEKIDALNQIMLHYSGRKWEFGSKSVDSVRVWQILIEKITGKQSKDKINS